MITLTDGTRVGAALDVAILCRELAKIDARYPLLNGLALADGEERPPELSAQARSWLEAHPDAPAGVRRLLEGVMTSGQEDDDRGAH